MKNYKNINSKINNKLEEVGLKKAWQKVMTKGNLWAVAIGLLIGAVFGTLVNSLANDIIMQSIARLFHYKGVNYMSWGTTKWEGVSVFDANGNQEWARGLPIDGIKYGKFLGALLSFVIVAFFLIFTTWIFILIWNKSLKKIDKAQPLNTNELILLELQKLNQNINKTSPNKPKNIPKKNNNK